MTFQFLPLLLLLLASPYLRSPQRESIFHLTRSTSSPSLATTLSMSSIAKPPTFSLAFLFSFYLVPPSPSSFFPRSLLLFFSRVHTSVALHFEVCLLAPISPFSTLQLPFSHLSFCNSHRFHFRKYGWSSNTLVHFTLTR